MFRTYSDFLVLLEETARYWPWVIDGERCLCAWTDEGQEVDPLTAVCVRLTHRYFDRNSYRAAAEHIGLHFRIADDIAAASDLAGSYNAHTRRELVRVLELNERWAPEGRWHDSQFHVHVWPHNADRSLIRGVRWVTTAWPARIRAR